MTRHFRPRGRRTRALVGGLLTAVAIGSAALLWPRTLGGTVSFIKVSGHSMEPHLHPGDLAVVRAQSSYQPGDVIAYRIPRGEFAAGLVVIHRIIAATADSRFRTQGDNRTTPDQWTPSQREVIGKQWRVIAGLGRTTARLRNPVVLAAFLAIVTASGVFSLMSPPSPRRHRRRVPAHQKRRTPVRVRLLPHPEAAGTRGRAEPNRAQHPPLHSSPAADAARARVFNHVSRRPRPRSSGDRASVS